MNLETFNVGDKVEMWGLFGSKSRKITVTIHSIHNLFFVFDTGKYKFCGSRFEIRNNHRRNPVLVIDRM